MENFLLIGCSNTHGLTEGFATLAAAITAAERYRHDPAAIPAIDDHAGRWIGEVTDQILFGCVEAVYADHEGAISLYVIPFNCVHGNAPALAASEAAALEQAKLAQAGTSP